EAWAANQRCVEPLGAREVQTIINSITRFITTTTYTGGTTNSPAMSDTMRQALAEMGRKGGKRNTPAQQAARAKGPKAAAKARKFRAYQQARKAQYLRRQGYNRSQIAEKLGKAACTISRYLRRWIPLTQAQMLSCITGASGEGAAEKGLLTSLRSYKTSENAKNSLQLSSGSCACAQVATLKSCSEIGQY